MRTPSEESTAATTTPRRLSRLFKVLVVGGAVGGAVAAAAYGSALQGPIGVPAAQGDTPDGGGSPGW